MNEIKICPKCRAEMKEWILFWQCRNFDCRHRIKKEGELEKIQKRIYQNAI
ncbi:MAG: hypothetical protein JXN64_00300 [Spirochaetes bacterium]|nr:hypothetical protein [Spirochaetota bacterium]